MVSGASYPFKHSRPQSSQTLFGYWIPAALPAKSKLGSDQWFGPHDPVSDWVPYPSPPMSQSSRPPSPPTVSVEEQVPYFYRRTAAGIQPQRVGTYESQPRTTTQHQARAAIQSRSSLVEARPNRAPALHGQVLTPRQEQLEPSAGGQYGHQAPRTSRTAEVTTSQGSSRTLRRPLESPPSRDPARATKTVRRTKAHVASACINCKRAHLSCDIQRPCSRCVATGKADTCYDVQHKKRGRPRLREERESHSDTGQGPAQGPLVPAEAVSSRTRHQRAESTVEGATFFESTSGPLAFMPPINYSLRVQTPVAFLNVDFVILKTNAIFQTVLGYEQDLRGRALAEYVAFQETEALRGLRRELLEEREARFPSYLPPIFGPEGYEAVQQLQEADIEHLCRGFDVRSIRMTVRFADGQYRRLPVQIRLARTNFFFVILTLEPVAGQPEQGQQSLQPPFQPRALAMLPPAAQSPYDNPRPPTRSSTASSAQTSPSYALSAVTSPMSLRGGPAFSPSQFSPPQLQQGYYPTYQPSYVGRHPLSSSPSPYLTSREQPSRAASSQQYQPPPGRGQSQVLAYQPSALQEPARTRAEEVRRQVRTPERGESEPEPSNGSRRRRRRLDIHEMLE